MDNLNLDTATTAMKLYATADLLAFQNRFDEAIVKLDSLPILFPKHVLEDDIWYAKAQILKKQRNYTEAAVYFQKIIDSYPEEIRADNATFELAELNELYLNNKEAAKKLYEKIITTYTSSTFVIEARKRFRALRGEGSAG
jgi:TolA-binding protein